MTSKVRAAKGIYPIIALISAVVVFLAGLLLVKTKVFPFYFISLALIYIIFGYGRALTKVLLIFVPISLITGLISLVSAEPLEALSHFWRTMLLGMGAVLTIGMEPVDLVRNLNQLKVPRFLTTGILICLRFIPVMAEEFKRIRMAMRLRGMSVGFYRPSIIYRAFFVPLIMRLMSISDTLSVSLETRAFTMDNKATAYKVIVVRVRDIIFTFLVLSLLIICFTTGGFW